MKIFIDRQGNARLVTPGRRAVARVSFYDVPPEILASRVTRRPVIDFFYLVLPHIGDQQVARDPVKAAPERVSYAVDPYFLFDTRRRILRQRVIRGDNIGLRRRGIPYVDAQDLSQEGLQVLAVPEGIAGASAVPEVDVQVTIPTEHQVAAVVIRKRLALRQQGQCRCRIGQVGVRSTDRVLLNKGGQLGADITGIVYIEFTAGLVVGAEVKAQEPFLAFGGRRDFSRDVQEGCRTQGSVGIDDPDPAAPFQYEQAIIATLFDVDRGRDTGDVGDHRQLLGAQLLAQD